MSDDLRQAFAEAAALLPDLPGRLEGVARRRRRRQQRRASAAVALTVLVTGAGAAVVRSASTAPAPPTALVTPRPTPAPVPQDPLALVGRWYVEADGVPSGTSLVLGNDLVLFLPCGADGGSWRASGPDGLFVAQLGEFGQGCPPSPVLPWLSSARGFKVVGADRLLLDARGTVLARLLPGARPTVGPDRDPSFAAPPVVTRQQRRDAVPPAALPPGAVAPTAGQLQRRWLALADGSGRSSLTFDASGAWSGGSSCNGGGGAFAAGRDGRFLSTSLPTAAVYCSVRGAPVADWVRGAARVGLVGGDLVLYDDRARVLGRLRAA